MISDRLKPVNFMSYPESRINLKNLYAEKYNREICFICKRGKSCPVRKLKM